MKYKTLVCDVTSDFSHWPWAGIPMKGDTGLKHFIISIGNYLYCQVNIWLIKLISWYCCFPYENSSNHYWKEKAVVLRNDQSVMWT